MNWNEIVDTIKVTTIINRREGSGNMEQFSKRFLSIVRLLSQKNDFLSSNELARLLNTSSKTILRTIKIYGDKKSTMEYGFAIHSKQRFGYQLVICEEDKFQQFRAQYISDDISDVSEKSIRHQQIINILCTKQDYVTIQELADLVYVSDSTVIADLKLIREQLKKAGIRLQGKTSKGIKIEGSELSLRLCLAQYVFLKSNDFLTFYSLQDIQFVEEIITKVLQKWALQISDISREHLISHILISMQRMMDQNYIVFDSQEQEVIKKSKEYLVAEELVNLLLDRFEINDKEEEKVYIAVQLLGKRSLTNMDEEEPVTKDITKILIEIFSMIDNRLGIDLTSDETVFSYLALHFEPMLTRLKYGIKSSNPLMEEVKIQQQTSFEMGLIAKEVIKNEYSYELDDNEVSYLAMYFTLALDHLNYLNKPKKILVVCGLGACSSRILVYKIRQQYDKYIEDIVICQYYELKKIALNQFDCIISTIDQPIGTKKPVIYVLDFITDLNDQSLDDFFLKNEKNIFEIGRYLKKELFFYQETMPSVESAIDYLLEKVGERIEVPRELKQLILEREQLSTTAFNNFCAIPHPAKMCSEETFCAVLVLNRSMNWNGKKVRYIFLLSPSKYHLDDLRRFNEQLAKLLLNEQQLKKFFTEPTYEMMKELITD